MVPAKLKTVRNVAALRRTIASWRAAGQSCALIPTMGALHEGHLRLVKEGLKRADRAVVTIFVNPAQFAPGEDLAKYPRDEAGDRAKLSGIGADLIYAPVPATIYPEGFCTLVSLAGPARAGLEDRFRPHFFDGVATVVAKLFLQAGCDFAIFGEKDYQQLKVVSTLARDLDIATRVIGVKTVREADGLAMSSRNDYLSESERKIAPQLHGALKMAAAAIKSGTAPARATANARRQLMRAGFKVDYVSARDAHTLQSTADRARPLRLLAAAWLGKTRLIDNISC